MKKLAWAIAIIFSANAFAAQAEAFSSVDVVRHILKDAGHMHKQGMPPPPPGHDGAPPPPRHHDAPPPPRHHDAPPPPRHHDAPPPPPGHNPPPPPR